MSVFNYRFTEGSTITHIDLFSFKAGVI